LPTRMTREDLHARIASPDRPVLVEALGAAFYADAHLPDAINIPQVRLNGSRLRSSQTGPPSSSSTAPVRAAAPTLSHVGSRSSATRRWRCTPAARRTGSSAACR
jgi:hypothetical protein